VLETRNGRSYAYESVRAGGRVERRFLASGPTALLIAECQRAEAGAKAIARDVANRDADDDDRREREVRKLCGAADRAVSRALGALGMHRPKRGAWRPRKGAEVMADELAKAAGEMKRTEGRTRGYMERMAETLWLDGQVGESGELREKVRADLDALRAELAGPEASPIERLLAERVALCYLDVNALEMIATGRGGVTPDLDRRRDRANRRYLAALTALARVRRLKLPALKLVARNAVVVR